MPTELHIMRMLKAIGAVLAIATLGGCASVLHDRGVQEVVSMAGMQLGKAPSFIRSEEEAAAARARTVELLAKPLAVDDAVEVALLNNRTIQLALAELGIAAANLAEASRPPNPGFSFQRLSRNGELEIERKITLDILSLLTVPFRHEIESRFFEEAKLRAARQVFQAVVQTRRSYFRALAAQQVERYMAEVKAAAEAEVELARRMYQVRNIAALDFAREQAFYAQASAMLVRTQLAHRSERERLTREMGLWGNDIKYTLPDRLPALPEKLDPIEGLEERALAERIDIRLAKAQVEGTSSALGLTRTTRVINVLEGGYFRNSDTGQSRQTGYEIAIEVPIFDFGDSKVTRAEAIYMGAVNRLAEAAIRARSEVRETYIGYRTAFDLAQHYRTEIIPIRKRISDEMLLRYNGMLASVFELILDAINQINSVVEAVTIERDFWLADTHLRFVTIADIGGREGERPMGLIIDPTSIGIGH